MKHVIHEFRFTIDLILYIGVKLPITFTIIRVLSPG